MCLKSITFGLFVYNKLQKLRKIQEKSLNRPLDFVGLLFSSKPSFLKCQHLVSNKRALADVDSSKSWGFFNESATDGG